jgi:ABC-2 type transport system ATP-binding protein
MPSIITARGLTRTFGPVVAVDDLDLDIPASGVVGLVGPNGSGKSTTIRVLLGLIAPTRGSAEVLGEPIDRPHRYAARVGALIESPAFLPNLTARANVASMASLRGIPASRVSDVLEIVGLAERSESKVAEFSLGMKQRLGIAIALLPDPYLLVLDEPTNGLDPAGIVEIRSLLRTLGDQGRTVLVSSHLLSEIEAIADHLVVIRSGRLLFNGSLAELLAHEQRYVDVEPDQQNTVAELADLYGRAGFATEINELGMRVHIDPTQSATLNRLAIDAGITLRRLDPRSETLEDVFLRMTSHKDSRAA